MHKDDNFGRVTLIVGAGLTGLTAGYFLRKAGMPVLLVEKAAEIGGCARSVNLDGIVFDLGPHYFFPNPDFEAERFMMKLLEGSSAIRKRFRFSIDRGDKLWKFPITIQDMIFFPLEYKVALLRKLLGRKPPKTFEETSARGEMMEMMGKAYYENTIGPMLLGKALRPAERIHRDWMRRVDRTINNEKEPFKPVSPLKHILITLQQVLYQGYVYPADGFGVFADRLWDEYTRLGGQTLLNCSPRGLGLKNGLVDEVLLDDKSVKVGSVVWTGSVNELNKLLGSSARQMEYLDVILVLVTYAARHADRPKRPYAYTYHTAEGIFFKRAYHPSAIFGQNAPTDREGVCLEANCSAETAAALTDGELVDRALKDAEALRIFRPDEVRKSRVLRLGAVMPVYGLDYENEMREAFRDIRRYRNLHAVGRLGGYYFCMSPGAVSQGIKVARHIGQSVGDSSEK